MTDDEHVARLRDRWIAARTAGTAIPLPELCREHPRLVDRVRAAIADAFWATGTGGVGVETDPAEPPPVEPLPVGCYEKLRRVGAGGRGVVYEAVESGLGRRVALKFLRGGVHGPDDPTVVGFRREAEITARLEHPGVVPVHACGLDHDGRPFYAMRFVSDRTLGAEIERVHGEADRPSSVPLERTPAFRSLLGSFRRVCETVAFANDKGLLHCDLKPRNIMIGDYGEAFVVDWGSALDLNATGDAAPPRLSGTAGYMSPEHQAGRLGEVGPASDVFGLGAVLYEILVGKPAFEGETREARARAVAEGRYLKPIEVRRDLSRPLDAICRKALASSPGDRYATAKELAEDLDRWSAGEPTTAWPEPFAVRARRWSDRNRRMVGVATLILIAASAIVAGVQRNARIVTDRARERAESRLKLAGESLEKFREVVERNPELRRNPEPRRKLLGAPLEFYRKLRADLTSDPDVSVSNLKALADANAKLAMIEADIGSRDDARGYYEEAIRIWTSLLETDPEDEAVRFLLGRSLTSLGYLWAQRGENERALREYRRAGTVLYRRAMSDRLRLGVAVASRFEGILLGSRGREDEALAKWEAALGVLGRIRGESAASTPILSETASLHEMIAVRRRRRKDMAGALEAFDEALRIRLLIEKSGETASLNRVLLARLHYNRGNLFLTPFADPSGMIRRPEPEYERAIEIYEDLDRRDAATTENLDALAACYGNLAMVQIGLGRRPEAVKGLERVRGIYARLLAENPEDIQIRCSLAITLHNLSEFLIEQGRLGEAEDAEREAITLQARVVEKTPDVAVHRDHLDLHYVRLVGILLRASREDEAAGLVRKRLALRKENPKRCAEAAREFASCAKLAAAEGRPEVAAGYLDEAARLLRRGLELGLSLAPELLDPEMKPLADRPEFGPLLLRTLDGAFPKDPFRK